MACECPMTAIERACSNVPAGLKLEVFVTCEDQVNTIPAATADTSKVETAITMRAADTNVTPNIPAGLFFKWPIYKNDHNFQCVKNEESGLYETTVTFFIIGLDADKSHTIMNQAPDNNIVVVPDKAGNQRIVGSKSEPCTILATEQTNPRSGYAVTVSWQSSHIPYFYTGVIPQ